jgi:hypothetical protein
VRLVLANIDLANYRYWLRGTSVCEPDGPISTVVELIKKAGIPALSSDEKANLSSFRVWEIPEERAYLVRLR